MSQVLVIAAVILLLISVNALYVAAEFAAVSVRPSRIQRLSDERGGLASRLLPYVRDARALDRYIAACQIGITVSSLVLGAYGQATLAPALAPLFERFGGLQTLAAQSTSAVVVLILLTASQMVLGELVPKSIALQYSTRLALWTVVPMQWSLRFLSWFIALLNGSGAAILRLVGFEASTHRHVHSPEELEYLLAESREGGLLDPRQHRRLRRALRLSTTRLEHFLVPRVRLVAIDLDAPREDALKLVIESPFTRLPVYRGTLDDVVGFLHAKDVARRVAEQGDAVDLASLVRPVLAVPQTMTADRLLTRMREERRQLALVLDEFGGTAGLVTIEDVLELVVGDIVDEFKAPAPIPERLENATWRLPGDLHLDRLEPLLGNTWRSDDAHTVGGHVMAMIGRVPRVGEHLDIEGVTVEVERVEENAIRSVIITIPERRRSDRSETTS